MTEPTPLLRPTVLATGITDSELRRELRNGSLERLAPGAYLTREQADHLDATARYRARVRAAVAGHGSSVVVSHVSAAVLHGLDVWNADLTRVHLTKNRRSGGRRTSTLHVHVAPIAPADDVVVIDGIAVTSPARTVADLARTMPYEQAVVLGDSALRTCRVVPAQIETVLARTGGRTGAAAARRAVWFLDGRSESPGESLSRIRMREVGMSTPELQYDVRHESGVFVARVDFYWEELGVVGEFDGMCKYKVDLDDPERSAEVVRCEKLREDAIRDTGREVFRWTWREIWDFRTVRARFERAVHRSLRRRG